MPGDVKFVHEASTGTMEMLRRLMLAYNQKKEVFADFGTPDAWNAYKGEAEYKGKPFTELRAMPLLFRFRHADTMTKML